MKDILQRTKEGVEGFGIRNTYEQELAEVCYLAGFNACMEDWIAASKKELEQMKQRNESPKPIE